MRKCRNNKGFSLTEMLIATGIMAIGLVMVATIFPVGIKLTSLSTERSIGAVACDEAFAKVRLYGLRNSRYWSAAQQENPSDPNLTYVACSDYQYASNFDLNASGLIDTADNLTCEWPEFRYPSIVSNSNEQQPYHWSALCRRILGSDTEVQVTVFVTRKTSTGNFYGQDASYNLLPTSQPWPSPVAVNVKYESSAKRQLTIQPGPKSLTVAQSKAFFRGGYTIVDDYSGKIYRVLEYKPDSGTLTLMSDWQWRGYESDPLNPPSLPESGMVWVVPSAAGSDRYPCVGVYQKVMQFNNLQ